MCVLLQLLLLYHQLQLVTAAGSEARVVNPTTGFTEGVSALRPISDSAPKPSGVPPSSPMPSQDVKRSYRRACQRALRQGYTTYRGRLLEARQVPCQLRSSSSVSLPQRPAPPTVRQGLRVFCWNAGGLGGGLYAELMTFLTNSPYDVAIILESKWQESMEYTDRGPASILVASPESKPGSLFSFTIGLHNHRSSVSNTSCKAAFSMCVLRCQARTTDTSTSSVSIRRPMTPNAPACLNNDRRCGRLSTVTSLAFPSG